MIIVLKPGCTQKEINEFSESLTRDYGVKVNTWVGTQSTVLGLIGDTSSIDADGVSAQEIVESVRLSLIHI